MFRVPRWWALCAALTLCVLPVLAADTIDDDEPEVTVLVTADRIEGPQSESIATATVITGETMRNEGAQTVADALKLVPGVIIGQSGQFGQLAEVYMRGTDANKTLILVDGVRISNSSFSSVDLSKFHLADVARIEVIRGPASSLYGSDALGGVIHIFTRQPDGAGGNLTLGSGNNGRQTLDLSVYGTTQVMGWRLSGSLPTYDGSLPNSDYRATNVNGRLTLPDVRGWNLALHAESYRDDIGLPNAITSPDPDDRMEFDRQGMDLTADTQVAGGRLTLRGYRLLQKMEQSSPNNMDWSTMALANFLSLTDGTTNGGEAVFNTALGDHALVAGLEYRSEHYEDSQFTDGALKSTQDKSINNRALFLQDRFPVLGATDLVLGLRYDDHSTAGGRLTPRVGISRAITPDAFLRLSYAEGFRSPGLSELYYNAFGLTGNPNLQPENSNQFELGLNWQGKSSTLDVAIFRNLVYNKIAWNGMTMNNIARTGHEGIEVSWQQTIFGAARLGASYNYTDAVNRDTGVQLKRRPRNQATLTLGTQLGFWNCTLAGRWGEKRLDTDPVTYGTITAPGRTIVDLAFTRATGAVQPYLTIRNLLNKGYEEIAGYRAEGRGIEAGIRSAWE